MQHKEYRLAAVMFTDIQGFSRMMERDEKSTLELLDYQTTLTNELAQKYKGRIIKTIGDALLVEFSTTLDAMNCALDLQNTLAEFNVSSGKDPLRLRIGIHLGDIYFFENDALGEGINIASRLQSLAFPGCICISQDVYNNVVNKIHADFRSLGRVNLKNITKEIRAYEIVTAAAPDYDRTTDEPGEPNSRGVADRFERTGAAASPTESAPNDFDDVKAFVIQQIKRAGRRISTGDVHAFFPSAGPSFDRAVERLADMGFLTRGPRRTGASETGSRDESSEPESREDASASTFLGRPMGGPDGVFGPGSFAFDREAWRAARHEWRHAARDAVRAQRWEAHHGGAPGMPQPPDLHGLVGAPKSWAEYRQRIIDRSAKEKGGFLAHAISFLAVNGFLFFVNLTTGFGFPWFLFPLGGWGIGLVSHFASVLTAQRERADVEALPEQLDEKDYELVRSYHRARSGARSAGASLTAVAAFLLMINLIVSPHYLWAAFPIAGLAIAFVSSVSSYLFRRGGFLKRIKELIRNKSAIDAGHVAQAPQAEDAPIVRQAVALADSILQQAGSVETSHPEIVADLKPMLENYVGQIRKLSAKSVEVEDIMAQVPRAELDRDLAQLRSRYEDARSDSLKEEYQKSIEQIERQNHSFEELQNQKELLDLKIAGSLNSLKQMKLDLARVAGITSAREPSAGDSFRRKAREFSQYLEDLDASYAELERMPGLGEHERVAADKLLSDFKEQERKHGAQ